MAGGKFLEVGPGATDDLIFCLHPVNIALLEELSDVYVAGKACLRIVLPELL